MSGIFKTGSPYALKFKVVSCLVITGCPSWNVTVDEPHEHTPSFRPENVSLTVEVNGDSNQFRVYATWDRQDSGELCLYE